LKALTEQFKAGQQASGLAESVSSNAIGTAIRIGGATGKWRDQSVFPVRAMRPDAQTALLSPPIEVRIICIM
jgi:hypothetical protein